MMRKNGALSCSKTFALLMIILRGRCRRLDTNAWLPLMLWLESTHSGGKRRRLVIQSANRTRIESLTSMVHGIAAHLPAFIDAFGDALTADARQTLARVFSSSLKPWLRLTDPHALTIIHGDAHTWNFLFPRSGDGAALLIDWQLWHVDIGARDLAFFIALHWYPSRRREFERPLIEYYYDRLLKYGVQNYSFDELWLDYRRCVVRNLTIPIIFWSRGMQPEGWWHRLECALMAYRDLACDELL